VVVPYLGYDLGCHVCRFNSRRASSNREKNREFFILGHLAPAKGHEPKDIEAFEPNSLDIGTGKFCSKNREILKKREFSLL